MFEYDIVRMPNCYFTIIFWSYFWLAVICFTLCFVITYFI